LGGSWGNGWFHPRRAQSGFRGAGQRSRRLALALGGLTKNGVPLLCAQSYSHFYFEESFNALEGTIKEKVSFQAFPFTVANLNN
jgi:hypothetical protein